MGNWGSECCLRGWLQRQTAKKGRKNQEAQDRCEAARCDRYAQAHGTLLFSLLFQSQSMWVWCMHILMCVTCITYTHTVHAYIMCKVTCVNNQVGLDSSLGETLIERSVLSSLYATIEQKNPHATWWQRRDEYSFTPVSANECRGSGGSTTKEVHVSDNRLSNLPGSAARAVQLQSSRGVAEMGKKIRTILKGVGTRKEGRGSPGRYPSLFYGGRGGRYTTFVRTLCGRCKAVRREREI